MLSIKNYKNDRNITSRSCGPQFERHVVARCEIQIQGAANAEVKKGAVNTRRWRQWAASIAPYRRRSFGRQRLTRYREAAL